MYLAIIVCFYTNQAHSQTFQNVASDFDISALPQTINFGSGLSFYDFDKDGLDDLSFTMTDDSLVFYRNTGDGFELQPSFVYGDGETKSVIWVDYDNDGDLDLAVAINNGRYKLYNNDGDFNFTDVSFDVGLYGIPERFYGLSFCDYDKDGFLDMYVCVYALGPGPVPYHDENKLFKNNGDGTFTDVTEEAGVGDGVRLSFQAVWFDYDMDGWVDLFVINDRLYENSLYKNNGDGTFTDVSSEAGIQFGGQDPMTASIADFDNDGDLDIYFSNTGVTGKDPKLLRNNGDGTFTDVAVEHGLALSHWTWGGLWVDYDNDTWQDLYVCSANPNPNLQPVTNFFYGNTGNSQFLNANNEFVGSHQAWSFSVARGDFNNDGFYDIAVLNKDPYDVFLWENAGNDNNYIKLTLEGTVSNKMAIGSWIKVYAGGNQYTHWTLCGENYLSQNSQHHIIGLGDYDVVDSLEVIYSLGHTDTYYDLEINSWHHLTEGETYLLNIVADDPTTVCEGSTVTLDAGEHDNYTWNTGADTRFIEVDESGTYTVTVTNEFGVTVTDEVEITIAPNPELLISVNNVTCFGDENGSIILQNLTGVEVDSVLWSNGDEGDELFDVAAGDYEFVFTDVNGCSTQGIATVTEPSQIVLETFVIDAVDGQGGTIVIFATGAVNPLVTTVNGDVVTGGMAENLPPGTYEIIVTDAQGCTTSTTVEVDNIVAVADLKLHAGVELYPNPASNEFFIQLNHYSNRLLVSVFDLTGRMLSTSEYGQTTLVRKAVEFPAGTYIVHVRDEYVDRTFKLIVQ